MMIVYTFCEKLITKLGVENAKICVTSNILVFCTYFFPIKPQQIRFQWNFLPKSNHPMRVWHTVMVAVLPVLSLSSSARVWRVVGFSSTKLFGAWQSWVFSSCIYGIVSSCQNNTNTRKVELKFCVAKGWSKHQFLSKMAGGRRGLVAPQNTFLENIIRRSSQQRKI